MMNLKHIAMKNVCNFRDLGGYPTADGRCTRWGMLYRSDALSGLPESLLQMIPDIRLLKNLFESRPETLECFLDELVTKDIRKVLDDNGFTAESQDILKASFTERIDG